MTASAPTPPSSPDNSESLAGLRVQIDSLDQQLLSLLNERAHVAELVGEVKKREGTPFFRPDRVAQVIEKMQKQQRRARSRTCMSRPSGARSCRPAWRSNRRSASPCWAPSAPSASRRRSNISAAPPTLIYCASFDEVFHATAAGSAQFGVVGVENRPRAWSRARSTCSCIRPPTWWARSACWCATICCARSRSLDGIEAVLAHPQALAQCQTWLSKHLPDAERRAVSSNAEGARLAATNPAWAALAGERAATRLRPAHRCPCHPGRGLQPHPLRRHLPAADAGDAAGLRPRLHQPGGFRAEPPRRRARPAGAAEAQHGVSMTRFESRPARTGQWEYYFYIDLDGHPSQPNVAAALAELRGLCAFYKVLGRLPVKA
jgi:chorismate mutase/prephenate dehydratase